MVTAAQKQRQALGKRIKELRATRSMTQEDLAERCDMFRTYMSRIESGMANPTLTMLYALAAGLEVEIQALFEPVQQAPKNRVRALRPTSRGRVER